MRLVKTTSFWLASVFFSSCGAEGDPATTQGKNLAAESPALAEVCRFQCEVAGTATFEACRVAGQQTALCEQSYDEQLRECAGSWCGSDVAADAKVSATVRDRSWAEITTYEKVAELATIGLESQLDLLAVGLSKFDPKVAPLSKTCTRGCAMTAAFDFEACISSSTPTEFCTKNPEFNACTGTPIPASICDGVFRETYEKCGAERCFAK
jgi:hypothetical protein